MGKANECAPALTRNIDHVVDNFDFGKHTACVFVLSILVVVLLLSAEPLILFFELRDNVHIAFWLGPVPIWLNLAVPISLCQMFLIIVCLNCRQSHHCIKGTLLCWFTTNGIALIGYGIYAIVHATAVSQELLHDCGSGSFSGQIQAEWERLHTFLEDCKRQEGTTDMFVQQCPGFAAMEAPPHYVYVTYIEEMESDYNCQGFCQFHRESLFNTESYQGDSCSQAVGQHLAQVGVEVGTPMVIIGGLVIGLGLCFQHYKHL
mmetsp:Transcript_121042/g.353730  ORF Transcript_121042/g.353730 Transcript_121042/m.353730 type:complete len:261 (-) Transcript_121042:74-856(-)